MESSWLQLGIRWRFLRKALYRQTGRMSTIPQHQGALCRNSHWNVRMWGRERNRDHHRQTAFPLIKGMLLSKPFRASNVSSIPCYFAGAPVKYFDRRCLFSKEPGFLGQRFPPTLEFSLVGCLVRQLAALGYAMESGIPLQELPP